LNAANAGVDLRFINETYYYNGAALATLNTAAAGASLANA
jgi:hypothetical protein